MNNNGLSHISGHGITCGNIDKNRIEQCFAAHHIVHSRQQFCSASLHMNDMIQAQQYSSRLLTLLSTMHDTRHNL